MECAGTYTPVMNDSWAEWEITRGEYGVTSEQSHQFNRSEVFILGTHLSTLLLLTEVST